MRTRAARLAVLIALLTVAAVGIAHGTHAAGTGAALSDSQSAVANQTTTAETTIRIVLEPDGRARFNVTMRFVIDSEMEQRAFERLATEFVDGDTTVLSADSFERAATRVEQTVDRRMDIRNVDRSTGQTAQLGRLSLTFTWTNFTRTNDDVIYLGDVFQTESGTWLPGLESNQELIIEFPADYEVRSSSHRLERGAFHFVGPVRFAPGEPSATLRSSVLVETSSPTPTDTPTPPGFGQLQLVVGLIAIVVITGLAIYLVLRRRDAGAPSVETPSDAEPNTLTTDGATPASADTDTDTVSAPDASTVSEEVATVDGSSSTDRPETTEAESEIQSTSEAEPDSEPLLSDEERVERLLRENGGRMKQVDIVSETGWSNAKVSQLLSSMDEDERVDKLRIGRENLISLPDTDFPGSDGNGDDDVTDRDPD